jgi:hypothetical protein
MKTGFSLCSFSLQGKTRFHYRFFPFKKNYTGKTLFSLQGGFAVWRNTTLYTHGKCLQLNIELLYTCVPARLLYDHRMLGTPASTRQVQF